jgi:ATP-dependent exoDNAse (exonuclease V) beta subunit
VAVSTVVEASAGTGKTTALVNGIVDAIAEGTPVEAIVAVTFTHAAAGNMKLRVRQELERQGATIWDQASRERLANAARSLDRAFIGTIHAFCAQLLRRHPIEAGVDPVFQELAQPDAMRVFSSVFRAWIEKRLASPSPALTRALARLAWREERDGASPLDALRLAAWSLAEWRDFDAPWEKRAFDRDARLGALIERAEGAADLRARSDRRFRDGLQPLAEFVLRARKLNLNLAESELLRLPREMRWVRPQGQRDPIFAVWEELKAAIEEFGSEADADLAAHLRDELWEVVGLYQAQKRRAGQLDFMDLLLYARDLLRHDAARAELQRAYRRIFVDEFQDTDPLQAEILLLLAAGDAGRNWRNSAPESGKLFVVGDPKQSIYRFRRADAQLFHRICTHLKSAGADEAKLTASTRSRKAIQYFVNAAFNEQIPDYLPLEGGVDGPGDQPAIIALPMPKPYGARNLSNASIEECSPSTVAAFIEWLCKDSRWKVRNRSTGEWVAVRPEHVCILFRRFTNFGVDLTQEYVRALEARGIEHLLVGSKSFHRREEVGTLRTALRAIEWPDDELSVFAVLRGSLCAVLDDTLLRFKNAYGRFHPMRELPDNLDPEFEPIRDLFALLRDLHRKRNYRTIAETIHELLETTRSYAAFAFRTGGERVLANVYRLTDLARSFEIGGAATSFRAFVEYLDAEYEVGDTSEAPVLEQEGGGVQLMTVHKAKGLEFPVVILADLTAKLTAPQGADRYTDPDRHLCAQRLLWCAPWELRDAQGAEALADQEEAVRLAYVAATRARDLLAVATIGEAEYDRGWLSPLHGALYPSKEKWRTPDLAPGCPKFGGTTVLNRPPDQPEEVSIKPGLHHSRVGSQPVVWFDPAVLVLNVAKPPGVENEQVLSGTTEQAVHGLQRYEEWNGRRAARIDSASQPTFRVAVAEQIGAAADGEFIPVETITLPVEPGRPTGRRFGRLVHDILQRANRVEEVIPLSRIWARRHGISDADCEVAAATAFSALERIKQLVPQNARQYREMPLVVRLNDGTLVDGRIDLAWSDGLRWTVLDYKTDRRERRRGSQLHLYALALQDATGLPARGIVLEI